MVSGTEALKVLAAFNVIVPVLAIITPPVAANGVIHSTPAVRAVAVLYCSVAAAPYVGAAGCGNCCRAFHRKNTGHGYAGRCLGSTTGKRQVVVGLP